METAANRGGAGVGQDGEWVNYQEALLRLGVTAKTLRRRILSGEIEAVKENTRTGPQWRIRLGQARGDRREATGGEGDGGGEGSDLSPVASRLTPAVVPADLYRELLDRHEAASGRAHYLQAQLDHLPALEAGAQAREAQVQEALARERALYQKQQQQQLWLTVGWGLALLLAGALGLVLILRPVSA